MTHLKFYTLGVALFALAPAATAQQAAPVDQDVPGVSAPPAASPPSASIDDRDVPGATSPSTTSSVPVSASGGAVDDSDGPHASIASASPESAPAPSQNGREGVAPSAALVAASPNPYPDGREPRPAGAPTPLAAGPATIGPDGRALDAQPEAIASAPEAAAAPEAALAVAEPEETLAVHELVLSANAPNPFGTETRISFAVPESGPATVELFDARGRRIAVIFDGVLEGGLERTAQIDGRSLAAGTYVYTLTHGGKRVTRTLQVAR